MDRDARIEVLITEDGMSAIASFFPAIGTGRILDPDFVDSILESREIIHGIDRETIAEIIFDVNTGHHAREGVTIATGDPPRSYRPAFYRVLGELKNPPAFDLDADRIDYRRISRLPVVHAGQTIARRIPEVEGVAGTTVRGEEVPFQRDEVAQLQPGKNTRTDSDRVVATVGGQLQVKNNEFFVEDRLEISGEVGYATGSVEFPGDVVLKGEVKDGFHIWAGGDVSAAGTVDVSEIYCRGSFEAVGGLVGRGKALLRAGGHVQARFIGNCYVESKASVYAKQYVYNSYLGCLDRLATGDKGRIVGGVVTAAQGVRCTGLGNDANALTTIRVGINFIAERKFRLSKEKHEKLSIKLTRLLEKLGDNPTDRQLDIVHRIEESRNRLTAQMGELAAEIDTAEDATVIVDGDVFPGVQIQICRATYTVEEKTKHVEFVLEKETGRVVPRPLDGS